MSANLATEGLPITWLWTRRCDSNGLWAARDTRWSPTIPDVVGTSQADVIRTAQDCDYTEDPEEIAPCLICGEPKPNKVPCDCLDRKNWD